MTKVDIYDGATIRCAGGTLRFERDGTVVLSTPGIAEQSVRSPDLLLDGHVEYWCGDDYGYFVGTKGTALWYVEPPLGRIAAAAELDRLNLRDSYDPGGLHRISFQQLQGGDLLLVYELGLARLTSSGVVSWQSTHDQQTAHLDGISDGAVWFQAEDVRFGFALANGRPVVPHDS